MTQIQSKNSSPSSFYDSSFEPNFEFEGAQYSNTNPFQNDSLAPARSIESLKETKIEEDFLNANEHANKQAKNPAFLEKISNTFSWIWGSIFSEKKAEEENSLNTTTDLGLTKSQDRTRALFNKEVGDMYERILEISEQYQELLKDPSQNKEGVLLKLLFLALKNQLNLKETTGNVTLLELEGHKKERTHLSQATQKLQAELSKLTARSDLAKKAGTILTAVTGVLLLAAAGSTMGFKYVPKEMPGFMGTVQSLTAFAKSGNTIIEGYTKGSAQHKEKEVYLVNVKKELAAQGVTVDLERLNELQQDISSIWQLLRELAEKQQMASSQILKN